MNVKEFIQQVLIKEFKEILQQKYAYISFILISAGIEFLGACLDNEPFHIKGGGISEARFKSAIKIFPKKYHKYTPKNKYNLYSNLRCGMLHVVIPQINIELIQRSEIKRYNAKHLEIKKIHGRNRLVLVAEDFFDDFEKVACRKVIRRFDEKKLPKKVYKLILLT